MTEAQLMNLIRRVVRQELAPIALATLGSNESQTRSTATRNQSEGPLPQLRNVQPYGLSSRAMPGTPVIVTPVNFDPSHLVQTGAFDESRPTGEDGETFLYNASGQLIYLSNGKIQIGTKASDENLVLGKIFKQFASELLEILATHTHPGIGTPPTEAPQFEQLKSSPIEDGAILSQTSFTE